MDIDTTLFDEANNHVGQLDSMIAIIKNYGTSPHNTKSLANEHHYLTALADERDSITAAIKKHNVATQTPQGFAGRQLTFQIT
jgi:hypothetical protein